MNVTVAVTHFNALNHLMRLIPDLREQGFTDIVILDDCSDDDSISWLETQNDISVIAGERNLGPTGNRNRILDRDTQEIILFIDCDMDPKTSGIPDIIVKLFHTDLDIAVMGSLILSGSNEPMWNNWGYDFSPKHDGHSEVLNEIALAHWHEPEIVAAVRHAARGRVGHFEPIKSRSVDWVGEAFFAVRASVFRELDGFDENFRMFHEGPDFCLRARQAGYRVRFEPSITLKHLDQHSGTDTQRDNDLMASTRYYYKKHFGLSDGIFASMFDSQ